MPKTRLTNVAVTGGFLAALLFIAAGRLWPGEPHPDALLIRGGRLIDGTGRPPLNNASVLIENGKIKHIFSEGEAVIPPTVRVIDANGSSILPGFIDTQVHLVILSAGSASSPLEFMPERILADLRASLFWGVTTVRSAGDTLTWILRLRDTERNDGSASPRLYAVGPMLTAVGGYPVNFLPPSVAAEAARQLGNADDANAAVQELAAQKVDMLKVVYQEGAPQDRVQRLPITLLQYLLEAAHSQGLRVSVRAGSLSELKDAVRAGADGIEHDATELLDREAIQLMLEHGTFYCPSLMAKYTGALSIDDVDEILNTGDVARSVTAEVRDGLLMHEGYFFEMKTQPEVLTHHRTSLAMSESNTSLAAKGGVKIVLGTTAGEPLVFHGLALHDELRLLVAAGLSPMQAIVAGTRSSAEYLGIDSSLGTIEVGKLADIVMIRGDPLTDIRATRNVLQVIKGGRVIDRSHLLSVRGVSEVH
jgi:imidazolonepropionase-like amidohydrolase